MTSDEQKENQTSISFPDTEKFAAAAAAIEAAKKKIVESSWNTVFDVKDTPEPRLRVFRSPKASESLIFTAEYYANTVVFKKKELEKLLELFPEDTEVKIVTAAVDNETVPSSFDPIPKTKVAIVFPGVFPG